MDLSPTLTKVQRLEESYELDLSDFTDALAALSLERQNDDVPNRTKILISRVVHTNYRRIESELALENFLSHQGNV